MMQMTHADFQGACDAIVKEMSKHPFHDLGIVHILTNAILCSKECCELMKVRQSPLDLDAAMEKAWIEIYGTPYTRFDPYCIDFKTAFRAGVDAVKGGKL